ncbi:MAG: N-acetyltransferase [Chloroflexi bacterium]|nr:N-acetyltransferase [Chloroflexota bacterium]
MTSETVGPSPAATIRQRASEVHALEERKPGDDIAVAEPLVAERALIGDAPEIHRLIQYWFETTGDVLPRTEGEIYETIRDFVVVRDPNGRKLLAAGALHVEWRDLAEIKSLVVDPGTQGRGLGRIVVDACLEEAVDLGLKTVFALTTTPAFFERLGFRISGVSAFPRKVWNECFRCPKYNACDEIAVTIDLRDRLNS